MLGFSPCRGHIFDEQGPNQGPHPWGSYISHNNNAQGQIAKKGQPSNGIISGKRIKSSTHSIQSL